MRPEYNLSFKEELEDSILGYRTAFMCADTEMLIDELKKMRAVINKILSHLEYS